MNVHIVQKQLSYQVVGVAMEVHRELGPGLDELFYHKAMFERFQAVDIHGRYKPKGKLTHNGIFADGFEADFLIDDSMILELKQLDGDFSPAHYAQIITYLKHWDVPVGLLLDFGKESLSYQRVVYNSPPLSLSSDTFAELAPEKFADRELFESVCEAVILIGNSYGLGYRDTTYRSLVKIELASNGLEVASPTASIRFQGKSLGDSDIKCMVVNDRCAIVIQALQDNLRAADRAITQTYLKHLNLNWGLLVNFGKKELEARYIWRGN